MAGDDIRWKQRFQNFEKAYTLLYSALSPDGKCKPLSAYDELQKCGVVQYFMFTFELLWKTLKDYLEYESIQIDVISPRNVLKTAALSGILELAGADGEELVKMMILCNKLSHDYNLALFENALPDIQLKFLPEITRVYEYLRGRL